MFSCPVLYVVFWVILQIVLPTNRPLFFLGLLQKDLGKNCPNTKRSSYRKRPTLSPHKTNFPLWIFTLKDENRWHPPIQKSEYLQFAHSSTEHKSLYLFWGIFTIATFLMGLFSQTGGKQMFYTQGGQSMWGQRFLQEGGTFPYILFCSFLCTFFLMGI